MIDKRVVLGWESWGGDRPGAQLHCLQPVDPSRGGGHAVATYRCHPSVLEHLRAGWEFELEFAELHVLGKSYLSVLRVGRLRPVLEIPIDPEAQE